MKKTVLFIILTSTVFTNCKDTSITSKPIRFAYITGLNAEKVVRYKELHAEVWPDVLQKIHACNIRNYSIYLKKIDSTYYLFSYFEYIGNDFGADGRKMAEDPITQRWWRETDPCQQPLPDAKVSGKIWSPMEEVFHTE